MRCIHTWVWRGLGLVSLLIFLSFLWIGLHEWWSWQALKRGNLTASSQAAQRALPVLQFWSVLTWQKLPDVEVAKSATELLTAVPDVMSQLPKSIDKTNTPPGQTPSATLKVIVSPYIPLLTRITTNLPQTWFIKQMISDTQLSLLGQLQSLLPLIEKDLFADSQTWVVLFQNNQELRATGGFTGSLALVTVDQGSVIKIQVLDIYQPDGQFTGFIQPPPGVAEYLSEGKGWRLPDLNWSPDFPQSAMLLQNYLQAVGYSDIKGIVAVNLDVAQQIVSVTGDIYLPDYQTTITHENVAAVLRQNREEFFPGSIAKQQLLSLFVTQLKLAIQHLSPEKQLSILQVMKQSVIRKDLQFWAANADLQQFLRRVGASGELPSSQAIDFYLFPVESNVGINKANQAIDRDYVLNLDETNGEFIITFNNRNHAPTLVSSTSALAQANNMHYVNYQRVLIKPETQVRSVTFNGQPLSWREDLITTSQGESLKQLGFLLVVAENNQSQVRIELSYPSLTPSSTVLLGKQSGIDQVPTTLVLLDKNQKFDLQQDHITRSESAL